MRQQSGSHGRPASRRIRVKGPTPHERRVADPDAPNPHRAPSEPGSHYFVNAMIIANTYRQVKIR